MDNVLFGKLLYSDEQWQESEEGKTDQLMWAGLHAVILAVMEELNSSKTAPMFGFYGLKGSGQWPGYMAPPECMETWPA